MASKKTVHSLNKFIKDTRISYLLRLYSSQPLTDSLIAEAGPWIMCGMIVKAYQTMKESQL